MDRAGGARISAAQWYPEIEYLEAQGLNQVQIATALGMTERRVRQIKEQGHPSGAQLISMIPEPKRKENLSPEHAAMLPLTVEAYERFFLEFSPFEEILPLHRSWVENIIEHRNVILNVPPRHAKSTTMLWLVLWLIVRNRDEEIIWVSKSANLAIKFCRLIAYHLEYNRKLIETFGRFAPESMGEVPWKPSSGQLLVVGRMREANAQFTLEARGSGQQILGSEATVVICDDVTDVKTSRTDISREQHEDWITGEVFSRVMPAPADLDDPYRSASGRVVVLGQRVHLRDTYGFLSEQTYSRGPKKGEPLWKLIRYPAILRWPDEDPENPEPLTLWPEVWPFEELMVAYERVGERTFETMYQQNPLPEGASMVREEWWEGCRDYHRPSGQGVLVENSALPIARVVSIDPSPTQWNAMTVADVFSTQNNFALCVIEFAKWKGGSLAMREQVDRVMDEYRPDYIIMESSTMTKWFEKEPWYQDLKMRVQVIAHQTGKNKGDAELGVESLAAEIQSGRIRLPYGNQAGRDQSGWFEQEATLFGHGFDTDVLMSVWFIKWNWRKLRPWRQGLESHFQKSSKSGWSGVKRAQSDRKDDIEKQNIKMWRKTHGSRIPG
jgi:hypothetical protein